MSGRPSDHTAAAQQQITNAAYPAAAAGFAGQPPQLTAAGYPMAAAAAPAVAGFNNNLGSTGVEDWSLQQGEGD